MRRARIKAVATVPVRRKATQDNAAPESSEQADTKTNSSEKPSEEPEKKEESNIVPASPEIKNKEISTPIASDTIIEKSIASPIKEKESLETKIQENVKVDSKNTVQPPQSPQKPATPSIEGSPVKVQNRSCFMRPTPKLDGGGRIRRNSVQGSGASASESEDDSKRSSSIAPNRVRNDSICSMQSLKDSNNTNNIAKLNLGQKRRMVVSESARKLAEARREFLLKHENKCPDKSKLTMYDLIYYNPVTNPMKPKPVTPRSIDRKNSVCSVAEKKVEEESVDEPEEMLVPQVKVGPNGQLIIDEQSLVIDQYKAQENIDRSDIIVDEDTTGNGFYKRRPKSKDWSKWETLKFYKALNTYGTDFLLMQSIFPKRSRQELKLKYKKEEKLNQNLIEKALKYQEFDTEALEKDLTNIEESEKKESENKKAKKEKNPLLKRKRKRCHVMADEVNCEQNLESNRNSSNEQSDQNSRITITRKVRKRKRKVTKIDKKDVTENNTNDSDSDPEVYKAKPTRSGRVSKKKKSQKPIKVFDVTNKHHNEKEVTEVDKNQHNNSVEEKRDEGNEDIEINDLETDVNNKISSDLDKKESSKKTQKEGKSETLNKQINAAKDNEKIEDQNDLVKKLSTNSNISADAFDSISSGISDMANLKPGSLVVLKKDSVNESEKTNLQVYIVSADYDVNNPNYKDSLVPIDLSPEILETVTNCIKDIEPENTEQKCNVP